MSVNDGVAGIDIRFDWNGPLEDPVDDDYSRFASASPAAGDPYSVEFLEPFPAGTCRSSFSPQPLMERLEAEQEERADETEVTYTLKRSHFSLHYDRNKTLAPSRRKKKRKNIPKRPLSAYNYFFQQERADLMIGNAEIPTKVGFEDLGKIVGKKWKSLSITQREPFAKQANKDSERYRKEMKDYNEREKSDISEKETTKERVSSILPPALSSGNHQPATYTPPYHRQPMHPPYFRPQPPYMAHGIQYPMQPFVVSGHSISDKETKRIHPYSKEAMDASISPSGIPLRSYQEVLIPDHHGHLKKYRVQYAIMSMSEVESREYMKQWAIPHPSHETPPSYMPQDF